MIGATANDDRIAGLHALAHVLIPGTADMPGVDALPAFDALLRTAVQACGYPVEELATSLEAIPRPIDWDTAKAFAASEPRAFDIVSTLATAAYYMAPQVLGKLRFPVDRQHPADVEEFLEEYETGILDAVTARGPLFRDPDGILSR